MSKRCKEEEEVLPSLSLLPEDVWVDCIFAHFHQLERPLYTYLVLSLVSKLFYEMARKSKEHKFVPRKEGRYHGKTYQSLTRRFGPFVTTLETNTAFIPYLGEEGFPCLRELTLVSNPIEKQQLHHCIDSLVRLTALTVGEFVNVCCLEKLTNLTNLSICVDSCNTKTLKSSELQNIKRLELYGIGYRKSFSHNNGVNLGKHVPLPSLPKLEYLSCSDSSIFREYAYTGSGRAYYYSTTCGAHYTGKWLKGKRHDNEAVYVFNNKDIKCVAKWENDSIVEGRIERPGVGLSYEGRLKVIDTMVYPHGFGRSTIVLDDVVCIYEGEFLIGARTRDGNVCHNGLLTNTYKCKHEIPPW